MDILSIIIIAIGLAMDAFAVSIACGFSMRRFGTGIAPAMPLFFGFFQGIMPVIGWAVGRRFVEAISGFDHWVAFALLVLVGGKMIYESTKIAPSKREASPIGMKGLLLLSVATSIDALVVGFSYSILDRRIIAPAVIIGVVTFILSAAGILIGRSIGHFFERNIEALGGIVIILIGVKILIEHIA